MKEFDEQSLHGGETDVDDGTPAAAVDEMTKEQVTKQYGIKAKLTVRSAMTKTHHEAPATTNRARWRRCRPRGRRARTASFR